MASNEYEIEDFMNLARAVAQHVGEQSNDNSEKAPEQSTGVMERDEVYSQEKVEVLTPEIAETASVVDSMELSPKQQELVDDLEEALKNIANMSNKEVKERFDELKTKFYAEDKAHRKQFKTYKKVIKKTIKSDKNRTWMRYLKKGKWLSVWSVIYGGYLGFSNNIFAFPMRDPTKSVVDYLPLWIEGNYRVFMASAPSPQAEIVVGGFALGIALYVGSKGLVKYDDIKTMRRMMIQALGENMTMSELQAIKQAIKNGGSVKDAMVTYPLRDYGKSPDTIAQERLERERIARAKEEAEKRAEEEKKAKQKAKEDDGIEM